MPFFNNSNDLYKQFQFESEHLLWIVNLKNVVPKLKTYTCKWRNWWW
jgi:hypothetical protein